MQKLFDGYGKVVDCRVMTGQSYLEIVASCVPRFHASQDLASSNLRVLEYVTRPNYRRRFEALNALPLIGCRGCHATIQRQKFHGKQVGFSPCNRPFNPTGCDFSIVVEFAKDTRPRRDPYDGFDRYPGCFSFRNRV